MKAAWSRVSSRREGLRCEMKLEDSPWMGNHCDITDL